MKKFIFSLLVFSVFVCSTTFALDIASFYEIKGNAKSMTRTDFSIVSKFGEYYRTPSSKVVYKLDSSTKVLESTETDAHDILVNKIVNTYDGDKNLTAQVCYDSENTQIWNTIITYKDGKKIDASEFSKAGLLKNRTIYAYTGNTTEESYYNEEGTLVWKIVSQLNEKGKIDVENEYFEDGTLDEKRQYLYNPAGALETISYFDDKSNLTAKDVFRYDEKGLLSEVTTYNADNKTTRRTLVRYDDRGNLSRITAYNVEKKFGTTINEMADMSEFSYEY